VDKSAPKKPLIFGPGFCDQAILKPAQQLLGENGFTKKMPFLPRLKSLGFSGIFYEI
jgi:hypothetical protein